MQIAATAIREYRRPVGLLVWQGRHAWVMSGFESTGDPVDGPFRVTKAYILDPLHPYGSDRWGPEPEARRRDRGGGGRPPVRAAAVAAATGTSCPGWPRLAGRYVLVVPDRGRSGRRCD